MRLLRTWFLFRWRFKSLGKRVVFGRMNRICGGRYIVIADNCSFGNNLRIETITRYGG